MQNKGERPGRFLSALRQIDVRVAYSPPPLPLPKKIIIIINIYIYIIFHNNNLLCHNCPTHLGHKCPTHYIINAHLLIQMPQPLCHKCPITHLNHKCPIPISPLCSDFRLHVYAESFHIMSTDVPAGVGALPLNTQCLRTRLVIFYFRGRLEPSWSQTLPLSCERLAS